MKTAITKTTVTLWLSANDTYDWAHRPGLAWPCSALSGHRLRADFDSNGLYDLTIDGRDSDEFGCYGTIEVDGTEFNAITSDFLAEVLPKDHPAYEVTVGQFQREEA